MVALNCKRNHFKSKIIKMVWIFNRHKKTCWHADTVCRILFGLWPVCPLYRDGLRHLKICHLDKSNQITCFNLLFCRFKWDIINEFVLFNMLCNILCSMFCNMFCYMSGDLIDFDFGNNCFVSCLLNFGLSTKGFPLKAIWTPLGSKLSTHIFDFSLYPKSNVS